jgi:hypothetical protein
MDVGPITFQIPKTLALRLARRPASREQKFCAVGGVVGMAASWLLACVSSWNFGMVLLAICFSALAVSVPFFHRRLMRQLALRHPGVATPQRWLFTKNEIVVTNVDGTSIHSPWLLVLRMTEDQQYLYLETSGSGKSPIPKSALGAVGEADLRQLFATSRQEVILP